MINNPKNYKEWIVYLKKVNAKFCRCEELPSRSDHFRVFLRHDIDLFDEELMDRCHQMETELGVRSTWFFLPIGDKRYGDKQDKIPRYIRDLADRGFEIGYHVNAWEKLGTYDLVDDPINRIDDDLAVLSDAAGAPIRVAAAHGIPRHKATVSNLSMFDALWERGVTMLDLEIIRDNGEGKAIPHFGFRSPNPLLERAGRIIYTSDSGGPIRIEWNSIDELSESGTSFVLNTHCANYDINRTFQYVYKITR
jgi:hypothetical protein